MTEPFELTVAEAANRIRRGDLSSLDLAESLLARLGRLEPDLRAWVTIDREGVLEAARQRDRELEEAGPRGATPRHTGGSQGHLLHRRHEDRGGVESVRRLRPAYDATCVAGLKEAGAVILGKAVTTEFAYADPSPTRNPWNRAHTPGGSSSGSAVAGGLSHVPRRPGLPDRRVHLQARVVQRHRRPQADLRQDQPLRSDPSKLVPGYRGAPGAHCGGRRHPAGRHGRPRPERPQLVRRTRSRLPCGTGRP